MPKVDRPLNLRLLDILNEMARCRRWLNLITLDDFMADDRLQYAVERSLQIMSEASRHIPIELRARAAEVDWRAVIDFGNLSRHGYHEVEQELIYRTAVDRLGPLRAACEALYREVKNPADPWPDAS